MLMAETEKYSVELSFEPHMPSGPFLVGGNTDKISPIWIASYDVCLFVFLCFFSSWKYKSKGIREVDKIKLSEERGW